MKQTDKKAEDYMLVTDYLNGDNQSWDKLYNESNQIVLGFTRKYILSFQADICSCEDVVAEAYARASNRLNTFNCHSTFSTWVCGFVKRIIWNEDSKNCRRNRIFSQKIEPFLYAY